MENLVILSGAGISAESGIQTFRDADGLWEGYDVMKVASISGWNQNKSLVLDFYNQRRKQLLTTVPNEAHRIIAQLEQNFDVSVITQNIDNLHEKAGSTKVVHLHGELLRARSSIDPSISYYWEKDIHLGDLAKDKSQLRPDVVWFGEEVPMINKAINIISKADVLIIIGTSLQVYPAANLFNYRPQNAKFYYIDPNAKTDQIENCQILQENAIAGMKQIKHELLS